MQCLCSVNDKIHFVKPKRQVNALSLCVRRPDSAAAETASFQFDATNIRNYSEMAKEIGRKIAFSLQISK